MMGYQSTYTFEGLYVNFLMVLFYLFKTKLNKSNLLKLVHLINKTLRSWLAKLWNGYYRGCLLELGMRWVHLPPLPHQQVTRLARAIIKVR